MQTLTIEDAIAVLNDPEALWGDKREARKVVAAASVATVKHGTVLDVSGLKRGSFSRQRVGTLSGYGHENGYADYEGATGLAKYLERLERGDKPVWLNAEAVVISTRGTDFSQDIQVSVGDIVFVDSATPGEGGFWRVLDRGFMSGDNCQIERVF